MLNELFELSGSLKRSHVNLPSWHRHFKECPRGGRALSVELDAQGRIAGVSPITDEAVRTDLRKYEKAAGYSFPSFNVPPLLQFESDRDKKRAVGLRKALVSANPPEAPVRDEELAYLLSVGMPGWTHAGKRTRGKDEMDQVNGCLSLVTQELTEILAESSHEIGSFLELLRRARETDGGAVYDQLKSIVADNVASMRSDVGVWMDILFFHTGKSPRKVAIVLELADQSQFTYPANHPVVQRAVNDRLLAAEIAGNVGREQAFARDAFGVVGDGLNDSFPECKMSVLGNVKLRAMSNESPCQRRYGLSDAKSYRVSRLPRQDMKNALEWVTRDQRRGKTWCDISASLVDSQAKAMLIAYPSELPAEAPELAGLLGGVEDAQFDPEGSRFEACARRVIEALQGQPASSRHAELHVFVLTKPDGFRTKVLHSSRHTIRHLLDRAEQWQAFCHNSPPIAIRQFEDAWRSPLTPYPVEVVWCLNTRWLRMATHAERASNLNIADGLSLLLDDGQVLRAVAMRAARTLISNSSALLLAVGQAAHQGKVHPMPRAYGKQALLLPGILALLIHKLGDEKGSSYMKNSPYLIGRLLSLADQLHVRYCREVRKGQVPPQLVGNALMTSAMEAPVKTLALFWQRIKPYHAWAQTVQGSDDVRLVKYFLGEMGRVCSALGESVPDRCSDTDKVALLLGYLAHSEKKRSNDHLPNGEDEGDRE